MRDQIGFGGTNLEGKGFRTDEKGRFLLGRELRVKSPPGKYPKQYHPYIQTRKNKAHYRYLEDTSSRRHTISPISMAVNSTSF